MTPTKLQLPPGKLLVTGNEQSCSASWFSGTFGDRGTVELSSLGGPEDWWVARAIVQGSPNVRSKGIGSVLLQLALAKAVEMGALKVTVAPGGYGMKPRDQQRFYEKNGFKKTRSDGGWIWVWTKR